MYISSLITVFFSPLLIADPEVSRLSTTIAGHHLRGRPIPPPGRRLSGMATERAAHSIPVDNFRSEQNSFDDWIKLFEDAVALATNAPDDRKEPLYKKWLPLKLDDRSRELLKNCTAAATWTILKEFKGFLADPQENYNWQTNRIAPAWDGK